MNSFTLLIVRKRHNEIADAFNDIARDILYEETFASELALAFNNGNEMFWVLLNGNIFKGNEESFIIIYTRTLPKINKFNLPLVIK